jgi:hypothetical protein
MLEIVRWSKIRRWFSIGAPPARVVSGQGVSVRVEPGAVGPADGARDPERPADPTFGAVSSSAAPAGAPVAGHVAERAAAREDWFDTGDERASKPGGTS